MPRHLHIDAPAGIAGDMFLGACIDLGVPMSMLEEALRPLPIQPPYLLAADETYRHGIRAIKFNVVIDETKGSGFGVQVSVPSSEFRVPSSGTYHHILQLIDALDASPRAKDRARAITTRIGQAEAKVHNVPLDQVHFHEVGAVDSIIDMLGAALALEYLGVDTVSSAPLPIGHGFVRCAHGLLRLPAPATAEILKSIPHERVNREGETVTPTGAALVAALATSFGPMPPMRNVTSGYGAGDRDTPDLPNLLRLFLGDSL